MAKDKLNDNGLFSEEQLLKLKATKKRISERSAEA